MPANPGTGKDMAYNGALALLCALALVLMGDLLLLAAARIHLPLLSFTALIAPAIFFLLNRRSKAARAAADARRAERIAAFPPATSEEVSGWTQQQPAEEASVTPTTGGLQASSATPPGSLEKFRRGPATGPETLTLLFLAAGVYSAKGYFSGEPRVFDSLWVTLLVAGIAWAGWKKWRLGVLMADTPTIPPSGIAARRYAETSGTVALPPGTSPLGHDNAAWCLYQIEQLVHVGKGSYLFKPVAVYATERPFHIVDEDGGVAVEAENTDIEHDYTVLWASEGAERWLNVRERREAAAPALDGRFGRLTFAQVRELATGISYGAEDARWVDDLVARGMGPHRPIGSLDGVWAVRYYGVRVGEEVSVSGPVVSDARNGGTPTFRRNRERKGLGSRIRIVRHGGAAPETSHGHASSARTIFEKQARDASRSLWVVLSAPAAFFATGPLWGIVGAAVLYPLAVSALLTDMYNRLVALSNQVDAAEADIDVALARRAALLRNLNDGVGAALRHELETHTRLTAARNYARSAASLREVANVMVADDVRLLREKYPELKASDNTLGLVREIARNENLIATSRDAHNQAVALMQTRLGTFPYNVLRAKFKKRAGQYFRI